MTKQTEDRRLNSFWWKVLPALAIALLFASFIHDTNQLSTSSFDEEEEDSDVYNYELEDDTVMSLGEHVGARTPENEIPLQVGQLLVEYYDSHAEPKQQHESNKRIVLLTKVSPTIIRGLVVNKQLPAHEANLARDRMSFNVDGSGKPVPFDLSKAWLGVGGDKAMRGEPWFHVFAVANETDLPKANQITQSIGIGGDPSTVLPPAVEHCPSDLETCVRVLFRFLEWNTNDLIDEVQVSHNSGISTKWVSHNSGTFTKWVVRNATRGIVFGETKTMWQRAFEMQ